MATMATNHCSIGVREVCAEPEQPEQQTLAHSAATSQRSCTLEYDPAPPLWSVSNQQQGRSQFDNTDVASAIDGMLGNLHNSDWLTADGTGNASGTLASSAITTSCSNNDQASQAFSGASWIPAVLIASGQNPLSDNRQGLSRTTSYDPYLFTTTARNDRQQEASLVRPESASDSQMMAEASNAHETGEQWLDDAWLEEYLTGNGLSMFAPMLTESNNEVAETRNQYVPISSEKWKIWEEISASWPCQPPSVETAAQNNNWSGTQSTREIDTSSVNILEGSLRASYPAEKSDRLPFPNANFLNLALHYFWKNVHPAFPVIHRPTFRPLQDPLLTLSMASAGAVYIGGKTPRQIGRQLYEQVRDKSTSAGVTSSTRFNGEVELLHFLQMAYYGQLVGYLIGDPTACYTSYMLNGAVIGVARGFGCFQSCDQENESIFDEEIEGSRVEALWHRWALLESKKRLAFGFTLQAGFAASVYGPPMPIRLQDMSMPWLEDESAYNQPDAQSWWSYMRGKRAEARVDAAAPPIKTVISEALAGKGINNRVSSSVPTLASTLSVLALAAYTNDSSSFLSDLESTKSRSIRNALFSWYQCLNTAGFAKDVEEVYDLRSSFHLAVLHLDSPWSTIELLCGKEGPRCITDVDLINEAGAWTKTRRAREALLHAGAICQGVFGRARLRVGALWQAHAALQAALCLWTYARFNTSNLEVSPGPSIDLVTAVDWEALHQRNPSADPATYRASVFLDDGGPCTFAGMKLEKEDNPASVNFLESLAAHIEGTSCWGNANQISNLLRIMSSIQ